VSGVFSIEVNTSN